MCGGFDELIAALKVNECTPLCPCRHLRLRTAVKILSQLFRFVSLRGPAALEDSVREFVVSIPSPGRIRLRTSDVACARRGCRSVPRAGWRLDFNDLEKLAATHFDGASLASIVSKKLLEAGRSEAEAVIAGISSGDIDSNGPLADRATMHILAAELLTKASSISMQSMLAEPDEQKQFVHDFFTRAVLVTPTLDQAPLMLMGFADEGEVAAGDSGRDPDAIKTDISGVREAIALITAAIAAGNNDDISGYSSSALTAINSVNAQFVLEIDASRLVDQEETVELLEARLQYLISELTATGDHSEGQPYRPDYSSVHGPQVGGGTSSNHPIPLRIGVGDLLLAELSSTSYEYGDIAHVENVLAGTATEPSAKRLRSKKTS